MVKESSKIDKNRENRDRKALDLNFHLNMITHDHYDRSIHQITLHYKRNWQNIQILLLFFYPRYQDSGTQGTFLFFAKIDICGQLIFVVAKTDI